MRFFTKRQNVLLYNVEEESFLLWFFYSLTIFRKKSSVVSFLLLKIHWPQKHQQVILAQQTKAPYRISFLIAIASSIYDYNIYYWWGPDSTTTQKWLFVAFHLQCELEKWLLKGYFYLEGEWRQPSANSPLLYPWCISHWSIILFHPNIDNLW